MTQKAYTRLDDQVRNFMPMVSEEIREEVGAENFFLFCLTAEQVYPERTGRSEWSELILISGGLILGELEHLLSQFPKTAYIETANQ